MGSVNYTSIMSNTTYNIQHPDLDIYLDIIVEMTMIWAFRSRQLSDHYDFDNDLDIMTKTIIWELRSRE